MRMGRIKKNLKTIKIDLAEGTTMSGITERAFVKNSPGSYSTPCSYSNFN